MIEFLASLAGLDSVLGTSACALQGVEDASKPEGQAPWTAFLSSFAATLVLLASLVWTGRTGRRRAHYFLVVLTVASLVYTIVLAEYVGSWWKLPPLPLRIHLAFAYSTSVMVAVAASSGLLHAWGKISRRRHQLLAWLLLGMIVMTSGSAVWMFMAGEPK